MSKEKDENKERIKKSQSSRLTGLKNYSCRALAELALLSIRRTLKLGVYAAYLLHQNVIKKKRRVRLASSSLELKLEF